MAFGRGFKKEKGNKYKNKKVEYDGIKFDSVREKDRYVFFSHEMARILRQWFKMRV